MTRRFVVPCRHGVHMRVATRIVTVATGFQSTIWFSSRTRSANAKSILGLLELGLTEGEAVTVTVRGPDAEPALTAIGGLLDNHPAMCGEPAARSASALPAS